MKCPICRIDLSPLDLVSRHEHVELCLENGPSVVEINETGQAIVKRNIPTVKQRKICPICDKTFQNILSHFKTCALKFDVPPNLMLEHWDAIQLGSKNKKKFPKELLDNFVAKCIKEGRVGEQVDIARALSLSIEGDGGGLDQTSRDVSQGDAQGELTETVASSLSSSIVSTGQQVADQTRPFARFGNNQDAPKKQPSRNGVPKKTYRLEKVDETTRKANIALRIDRELAMTRSRRYEQPTTTELGKQFDPIDSIDLNKLFFRARLKDCDGSQDCLEANCTIHELELTMEEFVPYSALNKE